MCGRNMCACMGSHFIKTYEGGREREREGGGEGGREREGGREVRREGEGGR